MTAETSSTPWVLIVDDEEDNRELLAEFLEVAGYDAVACGTAAVADDILDRRPPPCLAITDVRMFGMDGPTFVRRLRKRRGCAAVPAIFVTGLDASTLGPLGAPVLTKPVDLDALMALVDHHCGVGAPAAACS